MQHQKLKLLVIVLLVCAPIYAAVVTKTSFPVNIPVLPCAAGGVGEVVTMTGNLHVMMSVTVNANNVSFDSHFQPQGISGTGSMTGDKYQGTGITRFNFNADVIGFPFNTTLVNNFRIIGQGTGNDFLVHQSFHITVNSDGTMTHLWTISAWIANRGLQMKAGGNRSSSMMSWQGTFCRPPGPASTLLAFPFPRGEGGDES